MSVSRMNIGLAAVAVLALSLSLPASPAEAQVTYGPWRQTSDCRPARTHSGVGGTQLPRASAGVTQECVWVRDVTSCPRIRDRLRHPIQCTTRRQSQRSILEPRS